MSSSEDYSYVTLPGTREFRARTDPPSYHPSDVTYEYPDNDLDIRPRAYAFTPTSKTLEKDAMRKQSDPFVLGFTSNVWQDHKQLANELKNKLNPGKKDPKPITQKHSLEANSILTGSSTQLPNNSIPRSKSVENLDDTITPPLNITKIPIESLQTSNLSKNKSSSMNILLNRKVNNSSISPSQPNHNIETSPLHPLFALLTTTPSYEENIYEELDDEIKSDIRRIDTDYVTFMSTLENTTKVEENFTSKNRPPEPLPAFARVISNSPMTLPSKTVAHHNPLTSLDKHKTVPTLPNRPILDGKLSDKSNSSGQKNSKPKLFNKKKNLLPMSKKQTVAKKDSHPLSDNLSNLSRNPSFNFTLPLTTMTDNMEYVTSVPLYSLQRSQDFTFEFSKMNEFYGNGIDLVDDSDLSDDDESNMYDMNSLPRDLDAKSLMMATSLPSTEMSDYATYDSILKRISRYTKRATTPRNNPVNTDYVTYETAISAVVRSRSFDLDGYVTTGEVLRRQQNESSINEVSYVNSKLGTKGAPRRIKPFRPKNPQPSPRDPQAPKPSPRSKPSKLPKVDLPSENSTLSFDEPVYIEEDDPSLRGRLKPGRTDREELFIQSFHEYADSKLVDSPIQTPSYVDNTFPRDPSLKISKRKKSILKQPSRNSSLYTNYIESAALLRNKFKDADVEYDYIAPTEIRIPFRVSWAPLFFNDASSYVPNMEVAKLISALNVTNHINEGWDFEQYQSTVNTKATISRKQPPPIPPKTASMLRETGKRWKKFRPSLRDTPEDETLIALSRYGSLITKVSFRASFSAFSQFSSTSTTTSTESCFLEDMPVTPPQPANRPTSRGTFPSRPILPPYKEVPEMPSLSPSTTPCRVDENGDAITRSHSESKIEFSANPFPPLYSDCQTLNRHQAKEKKLKHCSNSIDSKSFGSFDSEGPITPDQIGGAKKLLASSPSFERDTLHLDYSKTILLGDEHIIQAPNSGVSLLIPSCDAIALAKKMGGQDQIEISINIFTNYNYWETKLDPGKKYLHRDREKYINLSPIVSISCNVSPPPNLGTMLLTIPICGQINAWHYQLLHKDIDNLYTSERKDKPFKLCDDRVEISTSSFGYYCIKGKYQEKLAKHVYVKKVVLFGLRMLFKQDRIQIGMCNDTPDDIKIFKEEMHKRHLRAIISQPCHYQLRYIPHPPPLKVSLQVDRLTELDPKAISFMSAWRMVTSSNDCEGDNPLTPTCTFTLPSSSHTLLLYVKLPNNQIEFSLNS